MPLLNRREFILTTSLAAGAVMFAGCVPPSREVQGESRVLLAEDLLSAYDNWYATTCRGCAAGCGVVVRVVDGRARKVEGNPDHPVNAGKVCARGQAIVQEQYHPDRVQSPLLRDASHRGSGPFQAIGWQQALQALTDRLQALQQQGRQHDVTLITPPLDAHQALLTEQFAAAYGLKWLQFEPISEAPLHAAATAVFGTEQLPWFDIQHARTILSFGADFLGTWLSPVRFGREYGVFRQGSYDIRNFLPRTDDQPRGRLIHVDTHFSTTAASADEWVWVRPGTEGLLALSIAEALGATGLDSYAAERTVSATAVNAERVRRIANELRNAQPGLVIGGGLAGAHTNGTEALSAILQLNVLLGNVDKPGGVLTNLATSPIPEIAPAAPTNGIQDWQDLIARMNDGREQAVLVLGGANPVHGLPAALGFADALRKMPFVASFSSFGDDTATLADLVLPSSLPLEEWGSAVPAAAAPVSTLSMQQPVVQAIFDTRSAWDVLLSVSAALQLNLPWQTFKDLLQSSVDALRPSGVDQATFWSQLLQHGMYVGSTSPTPPQPTPPQPAANQTLSVSEPQFAGDANEYPFNLVVFPHNSLGAGQSAHLPWLQAAPDPITSVTWQTWVELNPQAADKMQLREGDIVAVESPRGRMEAPAYISPAAPPEVLAMPLGQGHTGFGRWANGRGVNPLQLLEPLTDQATGALAYGATRVKISKTGRHMALPKLEGSAPVRQLPGHEVLEVLHE